MNDNQSMQLMGLLGSCVGAVEAEAEPDLLMAMRSARMKWMLAAQSGDMLILRVSEVLLHLLPEKPLPKSVLHQFGNTKVIFRRVAEQDSSHQFVSNPYSGGCHCDGCCGHCREMREAGRRGASWCCSCR